ncbi:MAG TPA: DUF6489 family protein [Alphaproteobacteria bacterium]|nr:DUF6489 family protein [Alphaproteobacteria bacterium]
MKVKIDIDCTPQEARMFLGLPDLTFIQQSLLADLEERMRHALTAMDPETVLKTWFPGGLQGWEQMQKAFWSQLAGAGGGERKGK